MFDAPDDLNKRKTDDIPEDKPLPEREPSQSRGTSSRAQEIAPQPSENLPGERKEGLPGKQENFPGGRKENLSSKQEDFPGGEEEKSPEEQQGIADIPQSVAKHGKTPGRSPNPRVFPLRGLRLYATAAVTAALAFFLPVFGFGNRFIARLSFAAAVWFVLRSVVSAIRSAVRWGKRKLDNSPLTGQTVNDYGFRTVLSAYAAVVLNLIYACFKFTVCARTRSLWFGVLGGYYAVLGISRGLTIESRRRAIAQPSPAVRRVELYRALRQSGSMMLVMTVFLSATVFEMVLRDRTFSDVPQFIYAIWGVAAYTVWKVAVAVVNVFRSHRLQDPALSAVREIGYADALVSLYSLQASLLLTFGGDSGTRKFFNALTGGLVCALVFSLGLYMVIRAERGIRRIRREEALKK